jgi:hypothetical protein
MKAMRFSRIVPQVASLCLLAAAASGQGVWAQGMGPDPFRPYNNQYDAFTYPLGPSGSEAAQAAAMMRSGLRGANQFQNYLSEMQGLGRAGSERYGQGLPYYRSVVDPRFEERLGREYRPNGDAAGTFEQTQQKLTSKYLAYFAERDPKKRAQLLRDYQTARRQTSRALAVRRENPRRIAESAARALADDRTSVEDRAGEMRKSTTRSSTAPRSRTPEATGRRPSQSDAPPPPRRSSRAGSSSGSLRTPSDILDRARRMESLRGTGRSNRDSTSDRTEDSRSPSARSTPDN